MIIRFKIILYNYINMKKKEFNCIDILNSFSEKEITNLVNIVSCPYFNSNKQVIRLLDILKKYVWRKRTFDENIQRLIYVKVFEDKEKPKEKLNKSQKNMLYARMGMLTQLMEKFLSIQAMEKNEAYKYDLLYPELLERQLFRLFKQRIKKEREKFDIEPAKIEDHYIQYYKLENNVLEYFYLSDRLNKEDNLPDSIYNLDIYYLLNRLSLQLTSLSIQRNYGREYDTSNEEILAPLLDYPKYAQHPMVMLYIANIELVKTKDSKLYLNILGLLNKHGHVIPRKTLKKFYTICISHCTRELNAGNSEYERKMYELFRIMHDKSLILDQGESISSVVIKNMVIIGCRVKEFEWSTEMTEYYRSFTPESIREHVYNFNLGIIAFNQKDFELAHDRFNLVGKINLSYDINVRVLIMKCLYETGDSYEEPTMQKFRTAESYFKDNKSLSAQRKKRYQNFIQILKYLYRTRHKEGRMTAQKIKKKLDAQTINADPKWLNEKITELKQKKS